MATSQSMALPKFDSCTPFDLTKHLILRLMHGGGNTIMAVLEPLNEREFFAQGVHGASPAWCMGHLACVCDLFTSWIDNKSLKFSRQAHETFNNTDLEGPAASKAEMVERDAFPRSAILKMFRASQIHAGNVLSRFDMRFWHAAPTADVPSVLPSYGAIWEHMAVHTHWHLGELAGGITRFHGTASLNTTLHYFYRYPQWT